MPPADLSGRGHKKYYVFGVNEVQKSYFKREGKSQGHKVIDLDVIWKGIISEVCMHLLMKSLFLTESKSYSKV